MYFDSSLISFNPNSHMLYWIVLTSGGLLMCHANSDFEENLLKTTIFRDPTSGWRQLMECKNDRHLLLFELSEPNKWLRDPAVL